MWYGVPSAALTGATRPPVDLAARSARSSVRWGEAFLSAFSPVFLSVFLSAFFSAFSAFPAFLPSGPAGFPAVFVVPSGRASRWPGTIRSGSPPMVERLASYSLCQPPPTRSARRDAGEGVAADDGVHLGAARAGLGCGLRCDVLDGGPAGLLAALVAPAVLLVSVRLVGGRPDVGGVAAPGQSGPYRAHRPGAGPLSVEDLLGDGDLLVLGGQIRARRVPGAAVGLPGRLGELEPAVVPVAGVDVPVAGGLAGGDLVPGLHVGRLGGAGAQQRERHSGAARGDGERGPVDPVRLIPAVPAAHGHGNPPRQCVRRGKSKRCELAVTRRLSAARMRQVAGIFRPLRPPWCSVGSVRGRVCPSAGACGCVRPLSARGASARMCLSGVTTSRACAPECGTSGWSTAGLAGTDRQHRDPAVPIPRS
ncbi:hypothetical protein RKD28_006667 [Streptomyces sp. SAI-229]